MKKLENILIGADPEMFLFSEDTETFIPVCGLVGGTKKEPLPISKKGHFVQEDNVMVEYCIPPSATLEEFVENILFTKNHINDTILSPLGYISKCVASAEFNINDLQSDQALEFGCDPDYNAYTYEQNIINRENPFLRTAGGHIHIGYNNVNLDLNIQIVRAMDLFLGLQSIILDPDKERRRIYGKAGSYRHKKYGVEYRVLSTFWTENKELIEWAWKNTIEALEFVNYGGIITNEGDVVEAINNSNEEMALEILDDYNIDINNLKELKICVD